MSTTTGHKGKKRTFKRGTKRVTGLGGRRLGKRH